MARVSVQRSIFVCLHLHGFSLLLCLCVSCMSVRVFVSLCAECKEMMRSSALVTDRDLESGLRKSTCEEPNDYLSLCLGKRTQDHSNFHSWSLHKWPSS